MSVTIIDIAKKAGVSYTTVSRALNGKKGVSEKQRNKILAIADQMGYHPNEIARGLVNKSTMSIGLIIPDITNPFFPAIARGIETSARKYNYNVFLYNTNWDPAIERECLMTLKRNRVDGIIINPSSKANLQQIEELGIPTVFLSTKVKRKVTSFVGVDNVYGAFIATEHLIKKGFKRVAFVGGTTDSYSNNMRYKGYKKALRQYGIKLDKKLVKIGKFKSESGKKLTGELLKLADPPDAIFAANDIIALGVLEQLQNTDTQLKNGFGVVGFDNIYIASLPQINLTTVEIPTYFMGEKAFEMLYEKIANDHIVSSSEYIIKPELIVRNTVVNQTN